MEKVQRTIDTIKDKLLSGWLVTVGLSGKDSMMVAHCAVEALKEAIEEMPSAGPLYLVTTDTTIENVEVHNYIKSVHKAAVAYGEENALPIRSALLRPSLLTQPIVSYLGYGKLLRTPQTSVRGRDCAIAWKITPMDTFLKGLREEFQTDKILNLSGSRDEESVIRAKNIAKRQESIDIIAQTDLGYTLAPIKNWTLQDVWGLAGQIEREEIDSFAEDCIQGLFKHYSAGNGGVCDLFSPKTSDKSKSCGARFGCYLCSMSPKDKSLEAQINTSPKTYGYMKGLSDLRTYMINTLNDMELSRSLLGRDEKAFGFLKVGWNQYSIEYRQNLLRYILTLDKIERENAEDLGIEPRFQLVGYHELIAIQFLWCKQGGEKTIASAFKIWHDVYTEGNYYPIPKTEFASMKGYTFSLGQARFVGGDSLAPYRYVKIEDFEHRLCALDGGRAGLEIGRNEFNAALAPKVQLDDGSFVNVVPFNEGKRFSVVDDIKAERFVEETYLDLLELGLDAHDEDEYVEPTDFLRIMLVRGIITLRKGQMKQLHKDARRAQLINAVNHAGRHFEYVFLANSISEEEYQAIVDAEVNAPSDDAQLAMGF